MPLAIVSTGRFKIINKFIVNLPVLTIASGNQRKVSEISEMLDVLSLKVQKQPEYLNVEETGKTYFENALLKAKAAA